MVSQSMPRAMFSRLSPISSDGIPQANSTISIPRRTSPRDSTSVLPCSRMLPRTSSSKCSSSSVLSRKKTRARSVGGVSAQPGKAAAAASTASLTCAAVHIGVSAITSPVEGLWTGVVGTPFTWRHSPPKETGQGSSIVEVEAIRLSYVIKILWSSGHLVSPVEGFQSLSLISIK